MSKKMIAVMIAALFVCVSIMFTGCGGTKGGSKIDEAIKKEAAAPVKTPPKMEKPSKDRPERNDAKATADAAAKAAADAAAKKKAAADAAARKKAAAEAAAIKSFEDEAIYFDYDRSELSADSRSILTKKAAFLKINKGHSLLVAGHCDERGTNEYNMALGEKRAEVAKKFLVALGIESNRISTVSYGEEKPASTGHTESAWAKNRRDAFELRK